MPTLADIRQQHPEYHDLSDQQLTDGVYNKFYSDIPRAQFDAKVGVASQGAQPELSMGDRLGDIGAAGSSGAIRGVLSIPGIPGDVLELAGNVGTWLGDHARPLIGKPRLTPAEIADLHRTAPRLPRSSDVINFVTDHTPSQVGDVLKYAPRTTAGEYARTAGEFVGASAIGGPKAALKAAIPALTSETGGQLTKGTELEPYARLAGAFVPALGAKLFTPFPSTTARQEAVTTLQSEGVTDLTAGQMTGNTGLRYRESELGGARAADILDRQGEQYTKAVLSRAGINASRATPDVIDGAFTRIGNDFDALASSNIAQLDRPFVKDLHDALTYYGNRISPPNRAPIVVNYAREIQQAGQQGVISGDVYQSLRSRISADARSAGDQYIQHTLNDMVGALDDAMERSIAQFNPSALGAWREARRQYRNMMVIERAATGAGEQAAMGIISPMRLRAAAKSVVGTRAFARGKDEFSDLARAGEAVMKPLPQSGTAPRLRAQKIFEAIPAFLGGSAGWFGTGGSPEAAMAGFAAGAMAPSVVGRAIMSNGGRRYLANQLLAKAPRRRSLVPMLNAATLPLRLPAPDSAR